MVLFAHFLFSPISNIVVCASHHPPNTNLPEILGGFQPLTNKNCSNIYTLVFGEIVVFYKHLSTYINKDIESINCSISALLADIFAYTPAVSPIRIKFLLG